MEGGTLMEITDLSYIWVVFDVYEKDLNELSIGQLVNFKRNGSNETFEAPISFISPKVKTDTRVVEVRVELKNNKGIFKPDMFVKALFLHEKLKDF